MIVRDQLNREVILNNRPQRIISLVPSQTEYLYDLGLGTELVGITKFCIHPEKLFRSCERVGGTKQLDLDKIRSLKPDLIIGNKEENTKEQIELLALDFPVWMSDVNTLQDAFEMMKALAELCGKEEEGRAVVGKAVSAMAGCKNLFTGQRVLYLMWYAPWMAVGSETFIESVLKHLGLENALAQQKRYPALSEADLKTSGADYCFLSSEPFPFAARHAEELQGLLPGSKTMLVDGEMFSWYGSRLIQAGHYFKVLKESLIRELK